MVYEKCTILTEEYNKSWNGTVFCGKYNTDYGACITNAANFLVA